ncbi:MAG: hypothetical protein RBQ77_04680 [Candidatus Methanomethylophilaceae archaeon]|jgi:sulfur carrier protein ThiS|nr:hypothetical protein [Candidatus Methanomethylophilaceae archaeon]NLF33862.1 hypothetical protein [Thermoplasmatales archaeon]
MAVILFGDRTEDVGSRGTVESAMVSLGIPPDSYLFLSDGVPIPMDTLLTEDLRVRAIRVASGG